MSFWNKVKKVGKQALKIAPVLITAASVVTAATPNPTDDAVLLALHKALDIIALNVANNAQDEE